MAEAVYFERSATSEAAFGQFLGASRTRQAGENRELSIVFFNAQTTHGVSGLGGCSVGIVADFNEEADTVLIEDPFRIITTLCPGGKERMRRLMDVIAAGRVDTRPLVTHRFSLENIVEAYELFAHQRDGVLKVALTP